MLLWNRTTSSACAAGAAELAQNELRELAVGSSFGQVRQSASSSPLPHPRVGHVFAFVDGFCRKPASAPHSHTHLPPANQMLSAPHSRTHLTHANWKRLPQAFPSCDKLTKMPGKRISKLARRSSQGLRHV